MNTASIAALRDAVEVPGTAPGQAYRRVVDALERYGSTGREAHGSATYQCPAHQDRGPSLSVREAEDRVLVHCFAGCSAEAVVGALGLAVADLFDHVATDRRASLPPIRRTPPPRPRRPVNDVDALLEDLRAAGRVYVPLERCGNVLAWQAECPVCGLWALLIAEYEDGRSVVKCLAGCAPAGVVATLLEEATP